MAANHIFTNATQTVRRYNADKPAKPATQMFTESLERSIAYCRSGASYSAPLGRRLTQIDQLTAGPS